MSKLLILNCDDFGQSPSANRAIMHLLEERLVSSATIMPPAQGFEEAAAWCARHPEASVGLHLTFTSEYDAVRFAGLTGHPSLHDESGHMYKTVEAFERGADPKAVSREMRAQFEAVARAGVSITHADNHMGSLYGTATGKSYLPQVFWYCSRRGVPFRLFRYVDPRDRMLAAIPGVQAALGKAVALADTLGVGVPDYLLSHPYHVEEGETYESFKRMLIAKLYELPEGVCETYIHPATPDERMQALVPSWDKRVWEYRLMQDDDFAYGLRDADVTLTTYRYVHEHLRRPRLRSAGKLLRTLLSR
ncbi:polysaccharide deacetylase family protein [Cohnella nanjingensis]|uniref:Polysaccharide deacetylase family protein n=1 Tax=Cohnella nanjingensis TaxID=1387779 RepID=A0A7X0VIH3_9BACL|nr:polysaccharide deacetylase family protein [Cohnella nanjingensis]MBB6675205.1 polysaccharide deacetylase family protein [Cohnella nanjingensis]